MFQFCRHVKGTGLIYVALVHAPHRPAVVFTWFFLLFILLYMFVPVNDESFSAESVKSCQLCEILQDLKHAAAKWQRRLFV